MKDMTIDLTPQEQDFLQSARQMGREAGEVLKKHFRRRDLDIEDKGPSSARRAVTTTARHSINGSSTRWTAP